MYVTMNHSDAMRYYGPNFFPMARRLCERRTRYAAGTVKYLSRRVAETELVVGACFRARNSYPRV